MNYDVQEKFEDKRKFNKEQEDVSLLDSTYTNNF